jgi:hypothetical protein
MTPRLFRQTALALLVSAAPVLALVAQPRAPLNGPGVSAELAQRRRGQLSAVRYELELAVGTADSAGGTVTASFLRRGARCTEARSTDARGLA